MDSYDRELIAEQIEYYSRRAPDYDETSTPPGDPLAPQGRRITHALRRFRPEGSVLEIACGTGAWTTQLVGHATEVTALDSSPEMLEHNRRKVKDAKVRYITADIFDWEPDRDYDVVMFADWLSHVPPTLFDDFWDLVDRCLKRGGRVFFTDEVEDAWRHDEELLEHDQVPLARRTLRDGTSFRVVKVFWDPQELKARLRRMGWDVSIERAGPFFWGEAVRSD